MADLYDELDAPPPVTHRRFDDIAGHRQAIYDSALSGVQKRFPIENATHRLELVGAQYGKDFNPSRADEKKALLEGGRLQRPITGKLRLVDKSNGAVLDEHEGIIAHIPHLNSRGLFIHNGTPWVVRNQQRLKPGVYARKQANGTSEAHFNISSGRGFRVNLEPVSGLFKVQIGQSTTKLYPVLKALGIPDEKIKEAWGPELFKANWREHSGHDVSDLRKLVSKLGRGPETTVPDHELSATLHGILGRGKLDPEVSELTLGARHEHPTPDVILHATKKVLAVANGAPGDVRDSLAFQSFHGPEDFFHERLARDQVGGARDLLWKASKSGKLDAFKSGLLTPNIHALFRGSGLAHALEDISPYESHDLRQSVTRLGEGGISSTQAVSRDARGIQPTYFGVIDSLRAPECYDSATEVMTQAGWKPWPAVTETDIFACLVDGKVEFHRASRLHRSHYMGPMFGARSRHISYLVTPNHRMYVAPTGRSNTGPRAGEPLPFRIETTEWTAKGSRLFMIGGFGAHEPAETVETFQLPEVAAALKQAQVHGAPPVGAALNKPVRPIAIGDWSEFLGWYLAEGCTTFNEGSGQYRTYVSQCATANPEKVGQISTLLAKLPFAFSYSAASKAFSLCGKQLASYLRQFGKSDEKFIPEYIFRAPADARRRFAEAILAGDGRRHSRGDIRTLCTTSKRLAEDFQRLMFGLGRSSNISYEADVRKETYLGCFVVYLHTRTKRLVEKKACRSKANQYFSQEYDGEVHCATVPGGLLYVRRNGSDGFWCGNSHHIGLDMRLTDAAHRGSDGQLYTKLRDKNGADAMLTPAQMTKKVVAFPGELAKGKKMVRAMVGEQMKYVNRKKVDYELPHASDMYSRVSNMIPLMQGAKGQRVLMGARMITQSMPLRDPESPLVHSVDPDGKSYYEEMGKHAGAVHAEKPGVVTNVTPDAIEVLHAGGEKTTHQLYNNYPMARKTSLHNTAVVKPGDQVNSGQLLAHSNFTDKNGVAAPGLNLRTGYLSGHGGTYEDAVVISESAAKKLSSEHQYKHELEIDKNIHSTKTADHRALYAGKFTPEQYANLDEDGAVKVGSVVKQGDPLLVGIGKKGERARGALMNTGKSVHTDISQVWDHPQPGVVTDVARTKSGVKITTKSYEPMTIGSKTSNQYGGKGVVSKIVPDDQMPHDEQGRHIELLQSPTGIITRTNPAVLAATLLGKIADKTGQRYNIKSFSTPEGLADFALNEAAKHGVKEHETLTDPSDGRKIPGVFTGNQYFMKLHHTAESKLGTRDTGGYSVDESPAGGGYAGSKRVGLLDIASLMSYGATEFAKDAKLIRGQRNDDYWRSVKLGQTPTAPRESFANKHFQALLRAAGASIKDMPNKSQQLGYLTDRDVDEMAQHEVTHSGTYDFKTMQPLKDGLFDLGKTGGAEGTRFAKIKLPAKVPNPLAQEPIVRMLGITNAKFEKILSGEEKLNDKSGPEAIEHALKTLNIDRSIENARQVIRSGSGQARDNAVRALGYFMGIKKQGLKPEDLMLSKMPVLPPKYRPILRARGLDMIHDANYLYHDLIEAGKNYEEHKSTFGSAGQPYLNLYKAAKAVTGLGDPINPKHVEQGVKGMLRYAIGVKDSPKYSRFQRKVLGNSVDTVGRSVITIDPDLDMDTIGIPEEQAWTQFRPWTIGRLVRQGMPATEAVKAVRDRTPAARRELDEEMKVRPVVYNRAPSLHRYNYVGGYAKINPGQSNISIPQSVTKGLAADFDGDAINVHVPASEAAVREVVEKLFPSKNLLHPGTFDVHLEPTQEFLAGLYLASQKDEKKPTRTFATAEDAKRAYARGEIGVRDPIEIVGRS